MHRIISTLALCLLLTVPALAGPPTLEARWRTNGKTKRFELQRCPQSKYRAVVRSPGKAELTKLTLSKSPVDANWTLTAQTLVEGNTGLSGVDADVRKGQRWGSPRTIALTRTNRRLKSSDNEWRIRLPRNFARELDSDMDDAQTAQTEGVAPVDSADQTAQTEGIAPVDSADLPVVKVLITGFDRFPRPKNHPRWIHSADPNPGINPAGWMVLQFQLEDLSAEFRNRVRVELYKCLDVPVTYVDGAKVITDTIDRLQPDVVISFGVGANSGADADVETTCENVMDDSSESVVDEDRGPFQLPADWPPETERSQWSQEDKTWLMRYPDNAGVSYNGAKIDPQGKDELTSSLPVDRIVSRVKKEKLRAIDGGWGAGRYICNNVMYKVIQTQASYEKLGGFIHVNSWSESRRQNYLTVVAAAIEESASAWLEQQRAAGLAGDPVVPIVPEEPWDVEPGLVLHPMDLEYLHELDSDPPLPDFR